MAKPLAAAGQDVVAAAQSLSQSNQGAAADAATSSSEMEQFGFEQLLTNVMPETRAALIDAAVTKHFGDDVDLLRMDEAVSGAYHLIAGRVRSWRQLSDGRALTLAYMSEGMVAGLIACVRGDVSPTTVTTTGPVEARLWPLATLRRLIAEDGHFASNMLGVVANYSVVLMDKIDDGLMPVEQRLARCMLRLANGHGDWHPKADSPDCVALNVTRQELADLAGSTLFTVSRILSGWERRDLVRSTRGRVLVTDAHGVAAIADLGG